MILILINVLMLQPGPHPAPMVKSGVGSAATRCNRAGVDRACARDLRMRLLPASLPAPLRRRPICRDRARSKRRRRKPAAPKAEVAKADRAKAEPRAPARPSAEIITDIQRELSRRGFYEGAVDGRYGPKTDAAIRDFEQAAGLKPSTEPSEALLRTIVASPVKAQQARFAGAGRRGAAAGGG